MAITWGKAMAGSKHFDKIAWTVTALILVVTVLFMYGNVLGLEVMERTMGYENRLFDNTRVHTIDIVMNDWDEFIADATSEEYYTAAVVIDGETYRNVGIRGKGNTSLSTVSSMNSNRYSFKVEFDHYDSSITYHGLDKLNLNNLIQDSTMMKDYLTYTMMKEFGAAAPLCSFVYITVNNKEWGLYLAVEGVEDSFLKRNYGSNYGKLYKPDSMSFGGGRGHGKDFNMEDFMNRDNLNENTDKSAQVMTVPKMPDMGNFDPSKIPEGFGGGMPDMTQNEPGSANRDDFPFGGGRGGFWGMGASDVKLQYIDDNTDSYSNIWDSAKTDITTADQIRLIESLKNLSNGEQIESVVDIEQVIRYFVVHNYVCNGDSYTGAMIHNYYLYEENGQMAMIPWDYNLAFGTFQGGNAQSTINTPIDSPISGGSSTDRPMWNWIVANKEYTELYHQYFEEFLDKVDIDGIINNTYGLIKSYVEKDPTSFYSYEEFETGIDTMRQFCTLRSESISMQLANGETKSNMSYMDGSGITLSDMGSMGIGGRFGRDDMPDMGENEGGFSGEIPKDFDPSQMPSGFGGETPKGFDPSQMPRGFNGTLPDQSSDGTGMPPSGNESGTDLQGNGNRPSRDNMQMPGGDFNFNMNGTGNPVSKSTNLIWLAVSVLILCAGLIIAKAYKY